MWFVWCLGAVIGLCLLLWGSTILQPGEQCGDNGEAEMRYWSAIVLLSAAVGSAASGPRSAEIAAQWGEGSLTPALGIRYEVGV